VVFAGGGRRQLGGHQGNDRLTITRMKLSSKSKANLRLLARRMLGEDYAALAAKFPAPPANAGLVKSGGFAQLNSLTAVPAQEWPTSTVGPSCNAKMRRVAATSSASEVSGFCTAVAFRPTSWRRPRLLRGSIQCGFGPPADFCGNQERSITHYGVVGRERSPASNEIGMGLESTP
jgi:hypothetical protein